MDSNHNWTFNHSPMIGFYRGKFYVSFISNPIHETIAPSKVMISTSNDSKLWDEPKVLFPPYFIDNTNTFANLHHRIGFHTDNNGRFFALAYYGISRNEDDFPNNGYGVGSVIREIYSDGNFGPIYFLKLNKGRSEKNINYPLFTYSEDLDFIATCKELLNDPLFQMKFNEELPDETLNNMKGLKAFSYYNIGKEVIGFWKWGFVTQGETENSLSRPYKIKNVEVNGGKIWAEKISNNKYALVFNPTKDNINRWPLSIATSEDGWYYSDIMNIIPFSPPRRYFGFHKSLGASYPSGIGKYSELPKDNMYIVFSVNKEDIWISIIPKHKIQGQYVGVNYLFNSKKSIRDFWDDCCIYMPKQSKYYFSLNPYNNESCLLIEESEAFDRFKIDKYFKKCIRRCLKFTILARCHSSPVHIQLLDIYGHTSLELNIDFNHIYTHLNDPYFLEEPNDWQNITISFNTRIKEYTLFVNGNSIESGRLYTNNGIERVSLETKKLAALNQVKDINLLPNLDNQEVYSKNIIYLKKINLLYLDY